MHEIDEAEEEAFMIELFIFATRARNDHSLDHDEYLKFEEN